MSKAFQNTVEAWFKREWGGSLHLPSGWFGRPYDNQHSLTSFTPLDGGYVLVLDKQLEIHFHGLQRVEDKGGELCFSGFDKCDFTWKEFGSNPNPHSESFEFGEVKIIGAPG